MGFRKNSLFGLNFFLFVVGQFLCGYDARVRGGSQSLYLCEDVFDWVALSGADVDVGYV